MNQNITVVDESIISKIREMIEAGWIKLKSFVNSKIDENQKNKSNHNLEFYHDLRKNFNNIASKLEELELYDELRYFLSISHFIKYIIYRNSLDSSFGHCQFAIDVLKFFIELFKFNLDFYTNSIEISDEEFKHIQREIKQTHWEYRREFYWNIYEPDDDYVEEKFYYYAKSLKE